MSNSKSSGGALGFIGGVIAAILSYKTSASILWAILHFIFGWFYIIYWLLVHWK